MFGEWMVSLEIVLKTGYIFLALGMWECSSVVEHSTGDPEVIVSIPLVLFFMIVGYMSKNFRCLKNQFSSPFWNTKSHE